MRGPLGQGLVVAAGTNTKLLIYIQAEAGHRPGQQLSS